MHGEGVEKDKRPWEDEPDILQFIDKDTGYKCFIRRHLELGHLCGYVLIPDDLVNNIEELSEEIENIDIHGGITFNKILIDPSMNSEHHAIGFDCAHSCDFAPYVYEDLCIDHTREDRIKYQHIMGMTYKDINFVKNECRKLAKQLHEILTGDEGKC